jgi:type I restriction enzyme S subunit
MASVDWRERPLGELVRLKKGVSYQGRYLGQPGPRLLGLGAISPGGGIKLSAARTYSGPIKETQRIAPGEMLVALTDITQDGRILGSPALVPRTADDDYAVTHHVARIEIVDSSALDTRFLFYFLRLREVQEYFRGVATGTTVRAVSIQDVEAYPARLPPISEQRAIAHILGTLDDKIDLNRRMSETLEAMARALFRSWFVDFDPVRAKAEGRGPGLPKHIADLFPSRLVGSELGEIPEGWEAGVLENALDELEVGGRPRGGVASYTEGVPSIGAESIIGLGIFDYSKTKYVPEDYFNRMTKGHIKTRDVLLYKDGGRPGEFEPHVTLVGDGFPFERAAINEHVYRLRARPDVGQSFLFLWLSSELVMDEMRIRGTGVAVPGLNSTQVKSLTTLFPTSPVLEAFALHVEPLVGRVLAACNESRALAALRDVLLPRLISGELRVNAAEQSVASTGL